MSTVQAIVFGARRDDTMPLVYEAFDWEHGVFVGASMRSNATSAAEQTGVVHDPMAMSPFIGYNVKVWQPFRHSGPLLRVFRGTMPHAPYNMLCFVPICPSNSLGADWRLESDGMTKFTSSGLLLALALDAR